MNLIAEPLTFLINAFLEEGIFPNHLKQAYVIPIFKKGDCEEPNNYRPISITPALSKTFEKVLRDQITQFLNRNKLLHLDSVSVKVFLLLMRCCMLLRTSGKN